MDDVLYEVFVSWEPFGKMFFMLCLFHGTFWRDGLVGNRLENDQELFNSSFINHVEKGKTSATVV